MMKWSGARTLVRVALALFLAGLPTTGLQAQESGNNLAKSEKLMTHTPAGDKVSFEDRVWAQEQLEQVYYKHRIWPKENVAPKPPFSQAFPKHKLQRKVEHQLHQMLALREQTPIRITPARLEAEIQRMIRDSQAQEILRDLFQALHFDTQIIAECLARPLLTERLLNSWRKEAKEMGAIDLPQSSLEGEWSFDGWRAQNLSKSLGFSKMDFSEVLLPESLPALGCQEWNYSFNIDSYGDPVARTDHTAVWTGTEMIIWGGDNGNLLNSGAKYNPATDTWSATSLGANVPLARFLHTAVWTGTEMIIWGGIGYSSYFGEGARYNPGADTWVSIPAGGSSPDPRYWHTAVWTGQEMMVWGGNGPTSPFDSGSRFNPLTGLWTPISQAGGFPGGRGLHSAIWTGSKMVVWGGIDSAFQFATTGGSYDPLADNWTTTPENAFTPQVAIEPSLNWTGSRVLIWGAYGDSEGRFDPLTNQWEDMARPWGTLTPNAHWNGVELVLAEPGNPDLQFYNPVTDSWRRQFLDLATDYSPEDRYGHTSVWTGQEIISWGGLGYWDDEPLNSGGKYNPSTNTWVPTSSVDLAPTEIRGVVPAWTGVELFLFGGLERQTLIWEAATCTWRIPNLSGAASPRIGHTLIWTGNEVWVWGGYGEDVSSGNSLQYLDDGARYHPLFDGWAPLPNTGSPPSARSSHTAIWTGNEMVIWGGNNGAGNSGSRLTWPDLEWLPLSIDAATPSPRTNYEALWTGEEMLVFGGTIADGALYSPALDQWRSMAPWPSYSESPCLGCTDDIYRFSPVWTGEEMLFFGGDNGSWLIGQGWRYNPNRNDWVAMSSINAPPGDAINGTGRRGHHAAWTGSEMLVWGGEDESPGSFGVFPHSRRGSRYAPSTDTWIDFSAAISGPADRSGGWSFWSGDKMVVWGESSESGPGNADTGGIFSLPSPNITSHPTEQWVCSGSNAVFSADVSGDGLTFQWQKDGIPLGDGPIYSGTNTTTLSLTSPTTSEHGTYDLLIQNACLTASTNSALLSVSSGPPASPGDSLALVNTGTVDLDWADASGADGYLIKRCAFTGSPCIPTEVVSTVESSQYSEPDDGASYFFKIEALNGCGAIP